MDKFDLKHSRQILSQGFLAYEKISSMKILLYGFNSLAVETIKNLLLLNVQHIEIYDEDVPSEASDLDSNYFMVEEDVKLKKPRTDCLSRLHALNMNAVLTLFKGEINEHSIKPFDLLIICELFVQEEVQRLNMLCRDQKKGFIYSLSLGLYSGLFIDFGQHFEVNNLFQKPSTGIILPSNPENDKFFYQQDKTNRELKSTSKIRLRPANSKNDSEKIFQINTLDEDYFKLNIDEFDKDYANIVKKEGGYYEEFLDNKDNVKMQFRSFEEMTAKLPEKSLIQKMDPQSNVSESQLFISLMAIMDFYGEMKRLPEKLNENDADRFGKIYEKIATFYNFPSCDHVFLKNLAFFAKTSLLPLTSTFGAIIAQESLKFIGSNKPIRQFLFHETYGFLNSKPVIHILDENSKHSNMLCLFGEEFVQKMAKERPIIIGSGAIGCELLKNLSVIGVGTSDAIIIVDPDNIELSNLCRQFLFNKKDIKKNKAEVAAGKVKELHPEASIISYSCYLDKNKRDVFNDEFWCKTSVLFSAVDNAMARKILNSISLKFDKPFFESGTEGLECNMEVILPGITSGYDNMTGDTKNETVASCTEKFFLTNNRDCISAAMKRFQKYFMVYPDKINKIAENFKINKTVNVKIKRKFLWFLLALQSFKKEEVINFAVKTFYDHFYYKIINDTQKYPNIESWAFPRKFPHAIKFNRENRLHLSYVTTFVELFMQIFEKPPISITNEEIDLHFCKTEPFDYLEEIQKKNEIIEKLLQDNEFQANIFDKLVEFQFFGRTFDKDNEFDIEFVFVTSNILSSNYDINVTEKHEVHRIAGNVVPAVITSTSLVCGLVSLEYLKYLFTGGNEKYLRNSSCLMNDGCRYKLDYLNQKRLLGEEDYKPFSRFSLQESEKRDEWDKIIIKGPLKISGLVKKIEETYAVEIETLIIDRVKVYDRNALEEMEPIPSDITNPIELKALMRERKKEENYKNEMRSYYKEWCEVIFRKRKEEKNLLLKMKGTQKNGLKLTHFYYLITQID